MSEVNWYYGRGEQQVGPLSFNEMQALVRSRQILPETLVWNDTMEDWAPASAVAALWETPASGTIPADRAEPRVSPLAVVSLVCGVLGLCLCLPAIPGVICGHIALGQIKREPHLYRGRELAVAGLVINYIAIALSVLALVLQVLVALGNAIS